MKPVVCSTLFVLVGVAACDKGAAPVRVASVQVTSPIGDRVAVGRTAQLRGEARSTTGDVMDVPLAWQSSAAGVASVSSSGLVSGTTAGTATITASVDGIAGALALRVIAAELEAIAPALNDPLAVALLTPLSAATKERLLTAIERCGGGAAEGNFTTIESCIASARAEVSAASDATDRALLATLALFFDHVERLLGN